MTKGRIPRRASVRRRHKILAGGGLLFLIVITAALAPVLAPHDPLQAEVSQRLRPPAWSERGTIANLLGTDQLGRDVWSRVLYGTRVSLLVGLTATLISGVLGVTLGLACAFR